MSELKLDQLIGTINQEDQKIDTQYQKIVHQLENFQKSKTPQFKQGDKIQNKKLQRESNYKIVSEDVSKYQHIVKKNREAQQIDYREQKDIVNINFGNKLSLLNKKKEYAPLSKRNLLTQEEYEKRIQNQLEKAKDKNSIQEELQKQKHLIFYKELKQKRLKKIKSKLYRRIKKRNQRKKQDADFQQRILTDKQFAMDELEKMERRRAEERSQMRHKNKSDYTRLLRKYAGENAAQQAYKNLNSYRQDIQNKLKEIVEKVEEESESDYDEDDYKQQAVKELDNLLDMDQVSNKQDNMIDQILQKQNQQILEQTKELKQQIEDDNWDQINNNDNNQEQSLLKNGKKIYENKEILEARKDLNNKKQIVNMSELLNVQDDQINSIDIQKQKLEKQVRKKKSLLDDINLDKIKKRYKEQQDKLNIQGTDILEQDDQKYQQFEVESDNDFEKQFQNEKSKLIDEEYQPENKGLNMKGWGNWTGFGAKQSQRQILQEKQREIEKIKKIEKIKQSRKDRNNNRIIINEKRPKVLKKYLIQQLPYGQVSRALGSEWNTEETYRNNTKSEILNYAGDEITPLNKKNLPKTKYIQLNIYLDSNKLINKFHIQIFYNLIYYSKYLLFYQKNSIYLSIL